MVAAEAGLDLMSGSIEAEYLVAGFPGALRKLVRQMVGISGTAGTAGKSRLPIDSRAGYLTLIPRDPSHDFSSSEDFPFSRSPLFQLISG